MRTDEGKAYREFTNLARSGDVEMFVVVAKVRANGGDESWQIIADQMTQADLVKALMTANQAVRQMSKTAPAALPPLGDFGVNTLAARWASMEQNALRQGADSDARRGMRSLFYAGAFAFYTNLGIASDSDVEGSITRAMDAMSGELDRFGASLVAEGS
jgi:hypothetical protein